MKIGVSTYSFHTKLQKGEMTLLDVLYWAKDHDCDHVELVPLTFSFLEDAALLVQVKETAETLGLELSGYSISGNFIQPDEKAFLAEVARIKEHVDIVHQLRIPVMRHDVTSFAVARDDQNIHYFNEHLPQIVRGCQLVTDYAKQFGITTTIENHGYLVQASDRVQTVLLAVDRDNFKTTLDVGNFVCVDENPLVGVRTNIYDAARVHLKDFYMRPATAIGLGDGWFRSRHDAYVRGAIIGHGDLPLANIIREIKAAGFDGYVVVEFEGLEDCIVGTAIGLQNVWTLWNNE